MISPVVLPRCSWGDPSSPGHALLAHGLGSTGALMWRLGLALAEAGWYAQAVDLRGHGAAPRALDYTLEAFATDLENTHPHHGGSWDVVVGHSLGGAAATLAGARHPRWTRQLVLLEPAIHLDDAQRAAVHADQESSFEATTPADVRRTHPHWHEQDIELKAEAVRTCSRWAVDQVGIQNATWDVRDAAAALAVPARVIASDPAVSTLFSGAVAEQVLTNPNFSLSVVPGAGHSLHRDKPDEAVAQLLEVLR